MQRVASALRILLLGFATLTLTTLLPVSSARADCSTNPATLNVVSHDPSSFCELCAEGVVRIVLNNTDSQALTNVSAQENLTGSGLEYVTGSTRISINGGAFNAAPDPAYTLPSQLLTWTLIDNAPVTPIPDLTSTHVIEYRVRAVSTGIAEDLVSASRQINASVTFDFASCTPPPFPAPPPWPTTTDSTGVETLALNEPLPAITKGGRNIDAGQGGYTPDVYGNEEDDVIWQLNIANGGAAAMQDMKFNDLMAGTNMSVRYACPTEGAAVAIANNDGVDPSPGTSGCRDSGDGISNNITDFIVSDPFGEPGSPADIAPTSAIQVYLVGKINSACSLETNTAGSLAWGCAVNAPAGGITAISSGATPPDATATLSNFVNNGQLQVTQAVTGLNPGEDVGARGLVTVTVTNNTGGTVHNITFRNTLPANYRVDPSFVPTINPTYAYGAYNGAVDLVNWTNPAGGSAAASLGSEANFLLNTAPEFELKSSTVNTVRPAPLVEQDDLLRHGDSVTITFRIVLTNSTYYDQAADLDVTPETNPLDPAAMGNLTNTVELDYEKFCSGASPTITVTDNAISVDPEDIDISLSAPLYIITNDPAYPTPLTVRLTNNGGHTATDYTVYVTFGEAMSIDNGSLPTGCVARPAYPPTPRPVWPLPAPAPPPAIPLSASVYECSDALGMNAIGPNGAFVELTFLATKNVTATDDDLIFRADVIGEITLANGNALTYPTAPDPIGSLANNYSLDAVRSRVLGFNLTKTQLGNCTEDNPPPVSNDSLIIGEECTYQIESGGWFGFQTPGFNFIAVENVVVTDQLPDGQGFLSEDTSGSSSGNPLGVTLPPTVSINVPPAIGGGPAPGALDEGNLSWLFNTSGDEIRVKDEFFRATVRTRLLNDPIDVRAVPNRHALPSTNIAVTRFDAVFDTTTITVDENSLVPGYPVEAVRRVDKVVTEPNILLQKRVCNETLDGVGTTCGDWQATRNDGDTNDSYIYRIRITNQASSGGVTRAPAYNIVSTDTLDASDLMRVVPFDSDGLDNDGDGFIDGADPDGEGTIFDPDGVGGGTPAVITFSHTHSAALRKINPGNANRVWFYYRVDPDDAIAPLQTLTNTVSMTYDTLEDDSGNQTAPLGNNSERGGARVYTTNPASAAIQIIPLDSQPKEVIARSNSTATPPTPIVTIGEEVEYRLTAELPVANLRDFTIQDVLPIGMRCIEGQLVDLGALPYSAAGFNPGNPPSGPVPGVCSNNGTNDVITWSFGDQELTAGAGTRFSFPVTFIARLENTLGTNSGDNLINGDGPGGTTATATYRDQFNVVQTVNIGAVTVGVREPQIVLTKTFSAASTDAGDVLTITVTATNTGNATAYNLRVLDDLVGTKMTYVNVGADPPSIVDTSLGVNRPIFRWNTGDAEYAIAPGATIDFNFTVSVDVDVEPEEILSNTLQGSWQSLPLTSTSLNSSNTIGADGAPDGMRNGSLPIVTGDVNDYETEVTTTIPVLPASIGKASVTNTYLGGPDVRIGDIVEYRLRLTLPEGTTNNIVLTDVLPAGLQFEGVVSVNGDTTAPFTSPGTPFSYAAINAPVVGPPGTVTWTLGTIVNAGDNLPNNDFDIVYRARVLNLVHPQVNTIPLINTVDFDYEVGTPLAPAPTQTTSETVNLLQPILIVAKSAVPANGDNEIIADEVVTYTVDIQNTTGAAPAYDTVLRDVIPVGQRNGGLTITVDSISLVVAGTTLPILNPVYDAGTGVAVWDFDTGGADTYTIPAGDTLRVVYRVQADSDISPALIMTNQAQVQNYYSFDDEAVPTAGSITGVREIYGPSNVDSVTLTTQGPNPLSKTNPGPTATIGETVTYTITVPNAAIPVALHDVVIVDDLTASGADLEFVSVTKLSGLPSWTPVNTGTATNLVIQDTGGGIEIPANTQIQLEVTVRVMNTAGNDITTLFSNTAGYRFNQVDGDIGTQLNGGSATTPNMQIVEPNLIMDKIGPGSVQFGQASTFTLNVTNNGTSRAWDVTVIDVLPNAANAGMCDTAPTNITARIVDSGGTPGPLLTVGNDYTASFDQPSCTLTYTMATAAASVGVNERLELTYDAMPDNDNVELAPLTNVAAATQWFSLDTAGAGATGQTRTYDRTITAADPGTPADMTDHEDALTIDSEVPVLDFRKSVIDPGTGAVITPSTATPGDTLRYRITVQNLSDIVLPGFSLTDEVDRLSGSTALFAPGTLTNVTVVGGTGTNDTGGTNANGGTLGTGILDVQDIGLEANGGNDTLTITFDVTLQSVITNGTVVLNQAQIFIPDYVTLNSDDPSVGPPNDPVDLTDDEPTQTLIGSAPNMQVQKVSQDLTGDPAILDPGDMLRYTITVKNIGTENLTGASLRDQIPANTTYVPNSTTLNGALVADPAGVSALEAGMPINAPEDTTPGAMRADIDVAANNVATITFDVRVNAGALPGTTVSNQGFVNGTGIGSGAIPEQPSDDPSTALADDPTVDVVGNVPLIDAQKTVQILNDVVNPGVLDTGESIRYTFTITNSGAIGATNVVLTDAVPAGTSYNAGTTTLNAVAVPDGGTSPLIGGLAIGNLAVGATATVTIEFTVTALAPAIITNQGTVTSTEQAPELTDSDGDSSNGNQPTQIVVGSAQTLAITKSVIVVGGGTVQPGSELEYTVQVTNIGAVDATNVIISDNLDNPVAGQVTYVPGSATLNAAAAGITEPAGVPQILTANYGAIYSDLAPGATATLRFRVTVGALPIGTTITNIAQVDWDATSSDTAQVSVDVGGTPGFANLNGNVWHDANFDNAIGGAELRLQNWTVEFYRNSALVGSVVTDATGAYQMIGLPPNDVSGDNYELRFVAPGAVATTASLGQTDSVFTDGPQNITSIVVGSGSNTQNLNLPIDPSGVVYDSVSRVPVAGATLTMVNSLGAPVDNACFNDPVQQGQVTLGTGYYKFDLDFSLPGCTAVAGANYTIQVAPPASGYNAAPSLVIPPSAITYVIPSCSPSDAIPATTNCEAQPSEFAPAIAAPTDHYLTVQADNPAPGDSQLFNNHIALDPIIAGTGVSLTKTSPMVNVTRGSLVPYTITATNNLGGALNNNDIVDTMPPGFKYVAGSASINGVKVEPTITGRELRWPGINLPVGTPVVLKTLLIVGSGVGEGKYVNQVYVFNNILGVNASGIAEATVRVTADPTFDCSDVIGKVFDDKNGNGYQDPGEPGLPGARVVTTKGLLIDADKHGRYHITCAAVPNPDRGSNFILKLDTRTLPTGYRVTSENPRVIRLTRGKMGKINFGATIHRVVRLDLSDAAFEPVKPSLRPEWRESLKEVVDQLKAGPSILRLSYLGDAETNAMAKARIETVRGIVLEQWQQLGLEHKLTVETELFWRRGSPGDGGRAPARDGMSFSHLDDNVVVSDIGENTEYLLPDANFTVWSSGKGEFELRDDDSVHFQRRVIEDITVNNVPDRINPMSTVSGEPDIAATSVSRLKVLLGELSEGKRLRLHFTGYTDDQPLGESAQQQYGDRESMSRAQAKIAADYFVKELGLKTEQVTYDGKGSAEPLQSNDTTEGQLANRRVEAKVWVEDVTERTVEEPEVVPQTGVKRVRVCRREPACIVVRKTKDARRMVVNRPVDPIRFSDNTIKLATADIEQLRTVVNRYRDKPNWQLRFTGHVDSMPISRDAQARFGDKLGLSRAHARVVARQVQQALALEDHQVIFEGAGDSAPLADNALPSGRARNRRVEVALWFDAPEDVLSVSEPQVCPTDADGRDHIAERYLPGGQDPIGPVSYRSGKPVINDQYLVQLKGLLERLQDKPNLRIVFAGYTESTLLNRRAAQAYGDNWGLAEARAARVRDEIKAALNLPAEMLSVEGKGLDESGVIDQGRVLQSPEGYVDLEIWFDVPVPLDENIIAELIRIQRNTDPVNPFSLAPMRVTVDGKRLDASLPHGADVQRCTDVALEKTNIQLRYDGHQIDPRLTVLATPSTIMHEDNPETAQQENLVAFQGYTNYPAMIDKAEIRLFRSAESLEGTPHAVIPLDQNLRGKWAAKWSSEAEYKYLLRVYDSQGRFDETRSLPLHVVNKAELLAKANESAASVSKEVYGESMLVRRGIPMTGGTVTVNAESVPKGHQVWVMNKPVPVDSSGKLVSQQIIPKGLHTVEVAVLDTEGNGQAYLRDLGMTHGNWFYTGIADVTMGMDQTSGPASLVTGDDTHYNSGAYTDGRFAFYAKGSTRKGLEITAHADTGEDDLGSLFSSIMDKRPQALFRRLDQDYEGYVYPTFGDGSKTTEDAPTQGKMYFKARKDNNFGLWGNFKAHWLDTDLARVDRGLYGAYGHYESSKTTSFGETRTRTDTFVAEPGTVRGREEFRGTGGSLYFLRHQDTTQGSESVWVEVRDQDSGLVLKTNKLVPGTDYTIDAIQGRVQLSAPLPSTADASQLVQAGSLSGHPVYLVVNYEYAPGLDELDSTTIGLRGSHWVNDSVKLGFTYHNEDQQNAPQNLTGVDLTWRKTAATYLKLETATTEGLGQGEYSSQDGGYTFGQEAPSTGPVKGSAQRVELVGQMQDFIANSRGRFTAYFQNREAGFSAPGQVTAKDTLQFGGSYNMKLDKFSDFNVKLDSKSEELGLSTQALSADYGMIMGGDWKMTAGIRHDSRDDSSAVVPTTQTEGERTDAAVRMTYDKDEDWKAYYFAQATVQRSGTRNANNRLGGGGEYQVNDKLKLIGELSTGDLGLGAKFGADYKLNDNSNLYSTYALDNERDVSGLQATKGNFVTGFRAKTSESMSVYGEERYTHGNVPTGLTHAYGVELAPENDWRYGVAFELGNLRDPNTAAVMDRTALSLTAAHTNDAWRYTGGFEYRVDDQSTSSRTTYLLKNRLMYQTDPNWSLFGKFNYSDSTSTQGEFYDGQFIEAVFGYAFRPVDNDRWNTVTKYTYFHNLPGVDQLSGSGTSADYIQRSHVLALDTSYDLNKRWTVGGKLAYRMGELSMDRANPEFFSSRGSLYALRADWHVVHDWDITVEGRVRNEIDAGDSRTGMLIGAYHHLGNNMKIGGGYNFADFSDDLTNMDYTTQGLFINVIGKF